MASVPVKLSVCPACEAAVVAGRAGGTTECPHCRYRWPTSEAREFGRRQWDTERSAQLLLGCLGALGWRLGQRKVRLVYAAVARVGFDWCRNLWFREAVAAGERWADTGGPPFGVDDIRRQLSRRAPRWRTAEYDWREVGLALVSGSPDLVLENLREPTRGFFADAYRDLIANPFVSIEWKPDWRTSTVLDLARTIYDRRAFELMPILSDALLDAGCDHQMIQEHCRCGRPHARGCWVLDAIIGRSS